MEFFRQVHLMSNVGQHMSHLIDFPPDALDDNALVITQQSNNILMKHTQLMIDRVLKIGEHDR